MPTNKFPAQAEVIERVKTILNLTDDALAAEVSVRPETLQKYAAGYQKAGSKLMQIIARLPETRRGTNRAAAKPPESNGTNGSHVEPPSAQDQLGAVLKEGTLDEVRLIKQVIGTLYRQITIRRRLALDTGRTRHPVFEGRPRLLPALGYVPAGLPQGGVEQIANQFIAVPAEEFPDAEFALKVHGDSMVDANIHHGDWVLLDSRREPRDGNVVAALCDNETTLKTYLTDGERGPFLRSENRAYPARIIPREEMQVQGVMVGQISARGEETAPAEETVAPF